MALNGTDFEKTGSFLRTSNQEPAAKNVMPAKVRLIEEEREREIRALARERPRAHTAVT